MDHGVSRDDWQWKSFADIATIESHLVDPRDYPHLAHIAPDSIEKRTGRLLKYSTVEADGVRSSKHYFYPGHILYSKIGPYLGKVVSVDFHGLCSSDIYPIHPLEEPRYVFYLMLSSDFITKTCQASSGITIPRINSTRLNSLRFLIPPLSEQYEIARRLDSLLPRMNQVNYQVDIVMDQLAQFKNELISALMSGQFLL